MQKQFDGERTGFQEIGLTNWSPIYKENELGSKPHILYKDEFKMDHRSEHKTWRCKTFVIIHRRKSLITSVG